MRTMISTLGLLMLVGCNAATTQPTPSAWTATAGMADFHVDHTATLLLDGRVLVAGGDGSAAAAAELYDPVSGTWSATGSLTTARGGHTATLLPDGRILVAGGYNDDWLAAAELYDPRDGTWSTTGSMTTARGGHTATLLPDGTVLVTGGSVGPGGEFYATSSVAEVYHPKTGEWTATASMTTARGGHTATLLPDGTVLVVGGDRGVNSIGSPLASAEIFDPNNRTWSATGSMAEARFAFRTILLPDGRVLVAGGSNASDVLATAELYDPSNGRWTATGSMTEARSNSHTATLLADGTVLVTGGGYTADGSPLASAELYDPGSGRWTATASMTVGRVAQTATLLPDGRVLVAGGDMSGGSDLDGDPVDIASAELYDP
jgi:N-acetylneuraminic acid mutarotase